MGIIFGFLYLEDLPGVCEQWFNIKDYITISKSTDLRLPKSICYNDTLIYKMRFLMTGIPITLNILLFFLFIIVGFIESKRLIGQYPNLRLEEVLKKARYLYLLMPLNAMLLFIALLTDTAFLWNLPLWLQFHYLSIMWGGILSIFVFIFSLTCFICFHKRRLNFLTSSYTTMLHF